jgi:hypothetical protein
MTFIRVSVTRGVIEHDIPQLLAVGESRGLLGMLDSIDCMHWGWKKLSYCMAQNVRET